MRPSAGGVHPLFDGLQIARARVRKRVAAVSERLQHEIRDLELGGQLYQGLDVAEARVDASIRDQPDQMHSLAGRKRLSQDFVGSQRAVRDRFVDPGEVLHHHGPRAQV